MELQNDKTIFKYLNPIDNVILSSINGKEFKDIFILLDKY